MTGEELKARRKGMGYTQEGLGKLLGVSRKTINEMENGATIDTRTEIAVIAETRRVKVLENTFWVETTNRGTYSVAQRLIREIDHPRAMFYSHGSTMLFGEFKRRDHAYRWCAALHRSDNARNTRELLRLRAIDAAEKRRAADG
ncbi:helix-turn-helix transcriptional regulator [Sphingobium sp. BHU LFT2]|uniref:helix-turn-helix transcriptional regulator n=1 Tax=Sphingobium sp. BHU LFT2 TaxID=2807634 RepID=UPI001BEBB52E|nr:helix-turn-helix transcriptional regulator [Sphingobium sp. BHU LFT2]MBT2246319.1 helix-turn-helix transcriptional regulator [Sphingobium sp. BHU LFT2]